MEVIPYGVGSRPAPRVIIVPLEQGGEPIFRNGMPPVQAEEEQESVTTQGLDQPVWADNLPSVSFDIALGEEYESVDFDVEEFTALADEYGMDDDARRNLAVHINGSGDRTRGGYYSPGEKHIEIYKRRTEKSTNKTMAHELKHAADDAEGILGGQELRYLIGMIGCRTSMYTTVGMNVHSIGSAFVEIPTAVTIGTISAYVLSLTASILGYWLHPVERRAFKAEKRFRPIIKFIEREDQDTAETTKNSTT